MSFHYWFRLHLIQYQLQNISRSHSFYKPIVSNDEAKRTVNTTEKQWAQRLETLTTTPKVKDERRITVIAVPYTKWRDKQIQRLQRPSTVIAKQGHASLNERKSKLCNSAIKKMLHN